MTDMYKVPMTYIYCDRCDKQFLAFSSFNFHTHECSKPQEAKMKKYRCRQLLADVGRGAIFEKKENGYVHQINEKSYIGFPAYIVEHNADWFEPIEEKSDEDLLTDFIYNATDKAPNGMWAIAHSLLSNNAINPEFIEKLRKGEV